MRTVEVASAVSIEALVAIDPYSCLSPCPSNKPFIRPSAMRLPLLTSLPIFANSNNPSNSKLSGNEPLISVSRSSKPLIGPLGISAAAGIVASNRRSSTSRTYTSLSLFLPAQDSLGRRVTHILSGSSTPNISRITTSTAPRPIPATKVVLLLLSTTLATPANHLRITWKTSKGISTTVSAACTARAFEKFPLLARSYFLDHKASMTSTTMYKLPSSNTHPIDVPLSSWATSMWTWRPTNPGT